jgi:predicted DNA-binding transcriptional regulator YafY
MNRFDRALAILLLLRSGKTLSAPELARRLEVSTRTIYRDIETLSTVGVPVYAEIGREGGFRLLEGYFLPPIAFSVGEATSLITGLAMLERLRARPFATELDSATQKLLVVMPDALHKVLSQSQRLIGFEAIPEDIFHPEKVQAINPPPGGPQRHNEVAAIRTTYPAETEAITVFLKGIYERQAVELTYHSPYGKESEAAQLVAPCGIVWDRNRWYLVGRRLEDGPSHQSKEPRLWRADRIVSITSTKKPVEGLEGFDIKQVLERQWLSQAMVQWAEMAPVIIRMTCAQAQRLKLDWYFAHARFEELSTRAGEVLMTFGENNQSFVFELLRWLGPGAELIEPEGWRKAFSEDIRAMLRNYEV